MSKGYIHGNHYCIIADISFQTQICFIKHVLTHDECQQGKWK